MTGNSPIDRSKLGAKRLILTDKNGIPLSVVISSANTHDIKLVTDVIDNTVVNRPSPKSHNKKRNKHHHLCLDKAYNSKSVKQEIIKRGYVPHIIYKRKRGEKAKNAETYDTCHRKRYPARRWVVERTNSWHNRFRKLFTRYEKNAEENYLGLVQLSCSIIIYRKIILG
jgi:transposase